MTPVITAGDLRQRIEVQHKTEERDLSGGVVEQWVTEQRRWAKVEPLQGRELFTAAQVDARVTHRVTMRYYAGLTASQRLLHQGRVLHILSVLNSEERGITTQVMAMEDV
jgi:SPP1 family predicted phage head-tail adaptor